MKNDENRDALSAMPRAGDSYADHPRARSSAFRRLATLPRSIFLVPLSVGKDPRVWEKMTPFP